MRWSRKEEQDNRQKRYQQNMSKPHPITSNFKFFYQLFNMKFAKYSFLFFLFLILILPQVALAAEVKVLYFFNPPYALPEDMQAALDDVKARWHEKVSWTDYDWSNEAHRYWFDVYEVVSLPVAVVECDGQVIKVKRSPDFAKELDETIYRCYGRDITPYIFLFAGVGFGGALFLVSAIKWKKKRRKKIKRRVKKARIKRTRKVRRG